ncbi:hypothetical protein H0G86_012214 [Trichoderma simmonsii]|uniref:Uncharacterized protein n=1 Tax=Trichoderma simmonsii TaxID=1491479 RepID=A0A8G0PLS5_9HYPO|nr:hypothetical protein H0G86_012214 [Trichoderma simmonsii]
MVSEETKSKAGPFGNEGRRVVLLVTAPVGLSFELIFRWTGFQAPQSPPIDWSSHENSALPDLASRLKFTTHYALCVIDCNIWESTSVSLLEKFKEARFWDHPGDYTMMAPSRSSRSNSSGIPVSANACVIWDEEDIRYIDSGEVIGRTDMSNGEITRDYRKLRQDWKYMPVYWNCHDLAIRLAYIIIRPSVDVLRTLKELMRLLHRACYNEIGWESTAVFKVAVSGWTATALGMIASAPPLIIAGAGVYMVAWSVGFFGGLKQGTRYQFMIKLEEKFPQLKSLHD